MYLAMSIREQSVGIVAVSLPIVGTRRKPNVSHKCEATDRVFVSSKRPNGLVFLPEFYALVCRACIADLSRMKARRKRASLPVRNSSPFIATTVKTDWA